MITYLLILICVLAAFQPGHGRFPAIVYAAICMGHTQLFGYLEGTQYFISASAADASIVIILCFSSNISRLSDILISVSLLSGAINAAGWALWWYGIFPDFYVDACVALYLLAILSLLRKDGACESGINICNSFFRSLGRPGYSLRSFVRQEEG